MPKDYLIERPKKRRTADKETEVDSVDEAEAMEPSAREALGSTDSSENLTPAAPVRYYATKSFSFLWNGYRWNFKQFEIISDELQLYHLLADGMQPIAPFEAGLVKCPNPKCGQVFVGALHAHG